MENKSNIGIILLKNIAGLILFYSIFNFTLTNQPGYNWVWNTMIKSNLKMIKANPNITMQQKHEAKQGFVARYYDLINKNTPEDAIILFPSDEIINSDKKFKLKLLRDRRKTTYFIYPRRAVYEKHPEYDSELMDKVTHVAIINSKGYDKLNYEVPQNQRQKFSILPIKR